MVWKGKIWASMDHGRAEPSKLGAGNEWEEKMSARGRDYFVFEQKNEAQVLPN